MASSPALSTPVLRRLTHAAVLTMALSPMFAESARADDTTQPPPAPVGGASFQGTIGESGSWESNPLLLLSGATPLYGSVTSPEIIFKDKTPTTELDVDTLVNENLFNQSTFDSTDVHLKAGLDRQMQQWSASLKEQTDYDTTRTSELSNFGFNVSPVRHLGLSLTPDVAFNPTAVDRLDFQGAAATSQYATSVFSGYETFTVTPSYTHNFDPLNAGVFTLNAQHYQSTSGASDKVDTIGPSIGWNGILTPRLSIKANVGAQETRQYITPNPGITSSSSGWTLQYTFSGDLSFKGQQDLADLTASRAEYPFGNGTEALLTTIALTDIHQLNPKFSLNLGASYQSGTYQSTATGDLNSLISGNSGLSYHMTDHLDLTATYQYRYETLIGVSGSAQDNTVTFGIVFHPKAWNL